MAIDPRRIRRGYIEPFAHRWKVLGIAAVACAAQGLPSSSFAQQPTGFLIGGFRDAWKFTPTLEIDETWSDNINLASAGNERSDFVTTISPGLHFTRAGSRLSATVDYSPQFLYYANGTNGNTLRNSLAATAKATLIQDFLTFDGTASISQQNLSPFGTQAANTVNGSTNRVESRNLSFGPTLQSRYNNDLTYTAGYRYTQSSGDSSQFATSHTTEAFGNFQTSTSIRDVGFGGNFDRTQQGYGGANEIITEQVGSNLTYNLEPTVRLHANLGYDRDSYPTTQQQGISGISYGAGFNWQPTHHTGVNVDFGHRYFGPTANVSLSEATPHWALNAVYTRDQTTSTGNGLTLVQDPNYALLDQFFRSTISDPVARASAVTQALAQAGLSTSQFGTATFLSNQIFLQKRADISVALLGIINTVTFDISRSESQNLSNITQGFDIFNQSQRFRTTQGSLNWSHRLGTRTNANATFTKQHTQAIEGVGDTKQRLFVVSINRQFTRHISATALYRNTVQTSDSQNPASSQGLFSGNYRENAVLASVRVSF